MGWIKSGDTTLTAAEFHDHATRAASVLASLGIGEGDGVALYLRNDLAFFEASFGTFEAFKETMSAQSIGVQGSGWGWLGYNKALKRVEILTKPNQVRSMETHSLHRAF